MMAFGGEDEEEMAVGGEEVEEEEEIKVVRINDERVDRWPSMDTTSSSVMATPSWPRSGFKWIYSHSRREH